MKKSIVKFAILIVSVIFFSVYLSLGALSYSTYSYSSYSSLSNVEMLQNSSQVVLVGTNGKNVQIDGIYPDSFSANLMLEHKVYQYNLCGDTVIFICPDNTISQTQIVLYNLNTDIITSFYVGTAYYCESSQIVYSDGAVYIADDYGNVREYNDTGKLLCTYEVHHDACHLICDEHSTVYCIANNGIYELYNNTVYHISSSTIDAPARFISEDVIIDDSGYIFTLNSNGISRLLNSTSTVFYPSGGVYNNCALIADFNTVYAVDIFQDKIVKFIRLQQQIDALCMVDENIFAFSYQGSTPTVVHIMYEDLSIYTYNNSALDKYPDITDKIYSDVYEIDHQNQWIVGIQAGTTVAKFKRNMHYDGFDIRFVRYDGKVITSGKVGTATVVTFYNDDISIDYELSVKGDLTGEGNMNTRDRNVMFDYLLDSVHLNGVYADAADMDYSNNIDTVDMVILSTTIDDIEL